VKSGNHKKRGYLRAVEVGQKVTLKKIRNTGYTQKNGVVSKVNKIFISHPTQA
jgi:hypothetical protein